MGRSLLGRTDLDKQSRKDEPRRKLKKKNRKSGMASSAPEKQAETEPESAPVAVQIEDTNCLICQEPVGEPNPEGIIETWSMLPCGHIFGSYCIKRYLCVAADDQPLCPICRSRAHHDPCGHPVLPFVLRPDGSHPDLVLVDASSGRVRPPTSLDDLLTSACQYCRDLEERRKKRQRRLERRQQRLQQQQSQQGQGQQPPTPEGQQQLQAEQQEQVKQPEQDAQKQPQGNETPKAAPRDDNVNSTEPSTNTPIRLKQPWRWLRALTTLREILHIHPRNASDDEGNGQSTPNSNAQNEPNNITDNEDTSDESSSDDDDDDDNIDDEELNSSGSGSTPRLTRQEVRQRRRTQATTNGVWQGPWVDVPTRDVEWEKWWREQLPAGV
ncbi:hypothetical protein VTJ49DRAFT_6108 [Mycothermus thermophilus]|uniref:RING-type domain-containing protein n=1 Tax=Humicola insolens TaxID=85995 RepID=A0ABR3VK23_HUMIN